MQLPLRSLLAPVLLAALPLAAQVETAPSARPPAEAPVWASSLEEAIGRARALPAGRVLVELRDVTCPECERMQSLLYPSASFAGFAADKVPVSVVRGTPDGEGLSRRFRVRTFPAWLVVTPDLLLCGKQEGESNQSTWIQRFIETEKGWAAYQKLLEAEKAGPGDPRAVFAVAEETFRRFGDAEAEGRFRAVAESGAAPAELRDRSRAYLATIALSARRVDDAEKVLHELLATTKDPALREKAELRLVDVDLGRGERLKAAERLRAFLAKYPDTPLRPQAEAILGALGPVNP